MTHVTAFLGKSRRFRNEFVFETALNADQTPELDFFYLVETPWRAQQLEELYLEHFPAVFEIPITTLPQFLHLIRRESVNNRIISRPEKTLLIEELLGSPESPFITETTLGQKRGTPSSNSAFLDIYQVSAAPAQLTARGH